MLAVGIKVTAFPSKFSPNFYWKILATSEKLDVKNSFFIMFWLKNISNIINLLNSNAIFIWIFDDIFLRNRENNIFFIKNLAIQSILNIIYEMHLIFYFFNY